MPADARGSIFKTPNGYGIRWPEGSKRPQRTGFATRREARRWFADEVAPRLRSGAPSPDISFDAYCDLFLARHGATVAPATGRTLAKRLAPARAVFGSWSLRELEGAAADVAAWRAALPAGVRYRRTLVLRQAFNAAVRWRYMASNPALDAGPNPQPGRPELNPFTPDEIDALEVELGPAHGPLAVFAAETGLRTHEWVALERRDWEKAGQAVVVQRRYAEGALTPYPKTARSRRRVPLTQRTQGALDRLPPRLDTPLLFPAARGGYIDLGHWRTREWYPALEAAGLARRGPYCLRHTFATEALAAGGSIFELARVMGTSVAKIDERYGHLARDSEAAIRDRLEARAARSGVFLAPGESS